MNNRFFSYQIFFKITRDSSIEVGRLGVLFFPEGNYVYTGSAKKNMDQRIARHLIKKKKLRWHIDYLLSDPVCEIFSVKKSELGECQLNQLVKGKIPVPGFGASDCKNQCVSHLKRVDSHSD